MFLKGRGYLLFYDIKDIKTISSIYEKKFEIIIK